MKNHKRILSLALLLCFILSSALVAPTAFAVAPTYSIATRVSMEDRTVSFDVSIADNPGSWRGSLNIRVSSEDFSESGYSYQVADGCQSYYPNLAVTTSGTSTLSFNCTYDSGADVAAYNGPLFTLTLKMKEDILPGVKTVSTSMRYIWTQAGYTNSTGRVTIAAPAFSCTIPDFGITEVESIIISPAPKTIRTTETLQLSTTVLPEDATRKTVTWTSSDSTVASVSTSGLVTPLKAGVTTITATAKDGSGVTGTCEVTVQQSVTGISLANYQPEQIAVAGTALREYTVNPANAYDKSVTWTSSNPAVATVDGDGTVTGVAPGYAIITVTTADGGYTKSYIVSVPTEGNAAKIGTTEYATLDEAFAALEDGQTVVLQRDVTEESIPLGTAKANCSLDLNGHALVGGQVTVPEGTSLKSIANGTIALYVSTGGTGTFVISGAVDRLSSLTITSSSPSAGYPSFRVSKDTLVNVIEDCDITGDVEVHGTANLITGCTVTGMVSAVGVTGSGAYTGKILNLSECTVTTNVAGPNYGAVVTQRGEVSIYSGTYTNINPGDATHPSLSVNFYQAGVATIYGGRFKGGSSLTINGTASGIRDYSGITIAPGYALSGAPDGDGYYTVVPSISTGTVTFNVTPADAALTVTRTSYSAVQTATSSADGTHVYEVIIGVDYTYSVSKAGYVTRTGPFRLEALSTLEIPITLAAEGGTVPPTPGAISGGATVTSGGAYTVESGATGTIVVMTKEPVKLVGSGISDSGAKFSDLTIDCSVAGANLTLENIWINNNVGQGTASGGVSFGLNLLNFTGKGNNLNFEGVSLLETQEYVQGAGIHVPQGAELTIGGSGTLYMYKYSSGAGIGGNSYEACGTITFAGLNVFIKGSKTGPLVGGDSVVEGVKNDPIYIQGGTLVLINKANGAAIGASKQGKGAGDVYLQGGNLTIISDYLGSAIGYGGDRSGTPGNLYVSGGSFKAVRTGNSLYSNSDSATQTPDDTLVTATKQNGSGAKAVSRLILDTGMLSRQTSTFTVSGSSGFTYSGGLHEYRYTETTSSTVGNFGYDNSDKNLYFYLPMETQTLTVNGETFKVMWNATSETFIVTKTAPVTPTISDQPTGATYSVGGTAAALAVTANATDAGALSYQWYSNTTGTATPATDTAISGATLPSYTPPTTAAGTTYYYCVVTNTVDGQTAAITSSVAAVVVETAGTGELMPPVLTADTTGNIVGQAVYLTFTDDVAWRSAISGITVNGSALTGGQYTVNAGIIGIDAGVFASAGDYTVTVTAGGYTDAAVNQTINEATSPGDNPKYTVTPVSDQSVYEVGETGGIKIMTVKAGVSGLKYFGAQLTPVIAHAGKEAVVFTHLRNGAQLSLNVTRADFDLVGQAQSGFNIQAGDMVKVFIVDDLTNDTNFNPTILQ